MIRTTWWWGLIVTLAVFAAAPASASIDTRATVEVEPGSGTVRVEGRVRWVNDSSGPVSALCLAFDDDTVGDLVVAREGGATFALEPDGGGVARVPLTPRVEPGASAVLDVAWRSVPTGFAVEHGSGPAIVSGGWVGTAPAMDGGCPPRVVAERGRFRLRVDVPRGWRVLATGSEVGREDPADADGQSVRSVWSVDDVDRLAWVAVEASRSVVLEGEFDPLTVPSERVAEAAAILGRSAVQLQLPPVQLRVVTAVDREVSGRRLLDELRLALEWFGLYYGGYPWPQLDVVLLPGDAQVPVETAPTLVAVSDPQTAVLWDPAGVEAWRRLAASVVAEETMASVVSFDASTPAALVAGLERHAVVSYLTWHATGSEVGDDGESRPWARCRLRLAASRSAVETVTDERTELAVALLLRSLERRFGRSAVASGLRAWIDDDRLGPTSHDDVRAALLSATGAEVAPVFDAVVLDHRIPDWSVRQVTRSEQPVSADVITTVVELNRTIRGPVPVDVRLRLADGREERRVWDADEPTVRWTVTSDVPVVEVAIDPEVDWPIEVRRADNVWRVPGPWWRRIGPSWFVSSVLLLRMVMWPWS